jgi:hypothetical protein
MADGTQADRPGVVRAEHRRALHGSNGAASLRLNQRERRQSGARTLAGHGGRVARIILKLWPDASRALLQWALVHDDGESVVGDVPCTTKGATVIHEQERAALDRIWPEMPDLTPDEYDRLRFADRLDAYMWAQHHAPHTLTGDGWPECRCWIFAQAEALGVSVSV